MGGQCACKQYVWGRRCDRCLPGYDNIRESNADGCSMATATATATSTSATSPMSSTTSTSATPTTSTVEPASTYKSVKITSSLFSIIIAFGAGVVVVTVVVVGVICVRRHRRGTSQPRKDSHRLRDALPSNAPRNNTFSFSMQTKQIMYYIRSTGEWRIYILEHCKSENYYVYTVTICLMFICIFY